MPRDLEAADMNTLLKTSTAMLNKYITQEQQQWKLIYKINLKESTTQII